MKEIGRIHHRREWERPNRVGAVGLGVDVIEDESVDANRLKPGEGCCGDRVGLVGRRDPSWRGEAEEQDTILGSVQEVGHGGGVVESHPPII